MNIGLMHYRVGETDGVSLEMEKWREVLEKAGHTVFFISGSSDYGEIYIPEMNLHSERFQKFVYNSFKDLKNFKGDSEFVNEILKEANVIENKMIEVIKDCKIDLLIPNNILSLGIGIPIAIALTNIIKKHKIKTIAHNHDFYWERPYMSNPTCGFIKRCLERYFPPKDENIKHIVINSIARDELKRRKNIDSTVIPNVFDFKQPLWKIDEFNRDLRDRLSISKNDIVFLHATRVTERKAIEIAIKVVGEVNRRRHKLYGKLYNGKRFGENDKIVMIVPGLIEAERRYVDFLKKVAREEDVEIKWCNSIMSAKRVERGSEKLYSLWDMYAISDMITYTSILEGWGNQFLEGIFSKKNMVVFEYPVYITDIKPLGFTVISLGGTYNHVLDSEGLEHIEIPEEKIISAAEEAIRVLKSSEEYYERVEKNFELGEKYLSYEVLEKRIYELLSGF